MAPFRVIAIDGPAASGKSTVARTVARELGFAYVNSGALYRALTWHLLQSEVDLERAEEIARAAVDVPLSCASAKGEFQILLDEVDPSPHLRSPVVNQSVSRVSSVPRVRELIDARMRAFAAERDVVVEGRDIGSVVFRETRFKFYLDASPEVRTLRRNAQGECDEIIARDHADSTRGTAPLRIAPDAFVIDSSRLTIPQVVREILQQLAFAGVMPGIARPGGDAAAALPSGTDAL